MGRSKENGGGRLKTKKKSAACRGRVVLGPT